MTDTAPSLNGLLSKLLEHNGSDLHLKVGSPPAIRVAGKLIVEELAPLTADDTAALANELMPEGARETFNNKGEADFAYGHPSIGRFRVNIYRQRGSVGVAIRTTSDSGALSFESLNLPRSLEEISNASRGLILITGGAGSGKTTTLTAMLDYINASRRLNIITLEDPIEVVHRDKMSLVSQREVGIDIPSIAAGLRTVLRQDPDVVYVSELRDPEAVAAALLAARTGHLVLSSMLATDTINAVDEMIEMFPADAHGHVRRGLADGIRAIISLRLIDRVDEAGRVPAAEVLVNTGRATDALAGIDGAPSLREVIIDGGYFGMESFDQSLLKLHHKGLVSFQDAFARASDPADFKLAVQEMGLRSA